MNKSNLTTMETSVRIASGSETLLREQVEDEEDITVYEHEKVRSPSIPSSPTTLTPPSPPPSSSSSKVEYRAILRKLDARLLPYTVLLNFLSYLDKYNLSQAHARNLDDELHLQGNQFAMLLSVYYPAFLVLHYLAGTFVQQLRTRRFVPTLVMLCGVMTMLMSLADSFEKMAAGRFMLGVLEGAIAPCVTILYTSWYPSQHMATRVTIFRIAAPLAGMASALVCAAFYLIDDIHGFAGWRWMFLAEGLLTFLLAVPGYWLVPNFIEQDGDEIKRVRRYMRDDVTLTRLDRVRRALRKLKPARQMLTEDERKQWSTLLVRQTGPLRRLTRFSWKQVLRPFVDPKTLLFFTVAGANQIVHSNMINFAPEVIKSFGFQGSTINLLSAGPLAFSVVTMLVSARISDVRQVRGPVLLPCLVLTLVGQIMLVCSSSIVCRYAAIYLIAGFSYPCNSLLITWCAGNVGPQYTKNSAMAILMVASTCTSLVSANIFPPEDAPKYVRGHLIGLISIVIANVAATTLLALIKWENKRRERAFPLHDIDADVLHAAMQYDLLQRQTTTSLVGPKSDDDDDAAVEKSKKAMTDDEARAFWHLTHLTNEEFARLGERHPGVRMNI